MICHDCHRDAPVENGVIDTSDHADDCAGVARGVIALVHKDQSI